jgi:hypothetical protein
MIQFEDPFERVLSFVAETYGITALVRFVDPSEFRSRLGFLGLRRPKGETFWPDDGGPPEIAISALLNRGVAGTLDILAHELAHVVAGPEAEHGPEWQRVYHSIFEACCEQPTKNRVVVAST